MDHVPYGSWTVDRLKEELRTRGASLRGKKKDLVERLEAYDRNANFRDPSDVQLSEEPEVMPWTTEAFHYPTVQLACPPVNLDCMFEYYNRGEDCASIYPKAQKMYKDGWMTSLMWSKPGQERSTYFLCSVMSEMTKRVVYQVKVVADDMGLIKRAACECTAGGGNQAKCKHVAVVLYALESLHRTGQLVVRQTCTELKQVWHQPKPPVMKSPVKAANIQYRTEAEPSLNPSPALSAKTPGEHDRIMNLIYNFQATRRRPLVITRSTGRRANMKAYCADHDYFRLPLAATIAVEKVKVTEEEARQLEQATGQQASSARWHAERCQRVTASRFGEVMNMRSTTDPAKLARRIARPTPVNVEAVRWGKDSEAMVLRNYELSVGVHVERRGLVVDVARPWLACSPDGVLPDRVVELKGIFSHRDAMITADIVDWLVVSGDGDWMALKEGTRYWYQVQGQMGITGVSMCDLVVFTDVDTAVIEVPAVPRLYEDVMCPKLTEFFTLYLAEEVVCG